MGIYLEVSVLLIFCAMIGLLFIQAVVGLLSSSKVSNKDLSKNEINIHVIVPAHNEEKLISVLLSRLNKVRVNGLNLSYEVILDHCTDDTQKICQELKSAYWTRNDGNPGKSHAIKEYVEYADKKLKSCHYFMIIDADCFFENGFFENLYLNLKEKSVNAFQVSYEFDQKNGKMLKSFSFFLFNVFRMKAKIKLFNTISFTGSGMGFKSSEFFEKYGSWPEFGVAEDLELSLDYVLDKKGKINYFSNATIKSPGISSYVNSHSQTRRWEHGRFFAVFKNVNSVFQLLKHPIKNFKKIMYFLDLCIPPLSLIGVFYLLLFIFSLFYKLNFSLYWMISFVGFISFFALGFLRFSEKKNLIKAVWFELPLFVAYKIKAIFELFYKRENDFKRSDR